MKNYYKRCLHLCIIVFALLSKANAQTCTSLTSQFTVVESRCAATGSIKVLPSGGSGNYMFSTSGPVNINFTTADSITGLAAGVYSVMIRDLNYNCTSTFSNIIVPGTYLDPRYTLLGEDVSCENGRNGRILLLTQQFGRAPFQYTIVAPSASGIGTTSSAGQFDNLSAGSYTVRLTDSCGGVQTRIVVINNYTWKIDSYLFTKTSCDSISGYIKVIDSRGNNSLINEIRGMTYGIVRSPGDTIWSNDANFSFAAANLTTFTIVAKDKCGNVKSGTSSVSFRSSLGANVTTSNFTCSTFRASITNPVNLHNASYCLFDNAGNQISCNNTGTFVGINYGSYCIRASDACNDTTISRCFAASAPSITLGNTVSISNKTCNTFSASVAGAVGITNGTYCLQDSTGNNVSCNTTGAFTNLTYGAYCIVLRDGCIDTTITRCFSPLPPKPMLPAVINPTYITCNSFGLVVTGTNLSNPRFCLRDSLNNILACNATGRFDSIALGSYCLNMYDSCYDTTITRCFNVAAPVVINDLTTTITNLTCSTFTATIQSSNITASGYCLYNSADVLIECNATGVFNNLPLGSYCIVTRGICPARDYKNCFTAVAPPPSLGPSITTSNFTCTSFSGAINNALNFTNPNYCLYDNNNNLITCNSTGVFDSLAYGSYCILASGGCYDTLIRRCFNAAPPAPSIGAAILLSDKKCNTFTAAAGNFSNLTNPRFCLYDNNNNEIICNATGEFTGLSYGSYCIKLRDGCYDTLIQRCFTAVPPAPSIGSAIVKSNLACSTFTATAGSFSNLTNPRFCLYDNNGNEITCNATGAFTGLAYGSYCMTMTDGCYDTVIRRCFSAVPIAPSLGSLIAKSSYTCTSFTASATSFSNITNPTFCLYNNNNVQISCNSTGRFVGIPYGSYCITMRDGCYDTLISRCFSAAPIPLALSVSARKSCSYGTAQLSVSVSQGVRPMTVSVYNAMGVLMGTATYSSGSISFNNLPGTTGTEKYLVKVIDQCGAVDSVKISAVASSFLHSAAVVLKCPSATWQNGSGNIVASASTNMGSLTVRIIRKNGASLNPNISPTTIASGNYNFNNLGPGQYIIRYQANDGCNSALYDTVTINPYHFPLLSRSSAYQCDNNGFSVGAVVSYGVGPFLYEIIGSTPASPSVNAPPQSSPVFIINNGTNYSLLRLRVVDACGNGSLQDASILPIANNGISASFNCMQLGTTLRMDSFYNSTYSWYKKTSPTANDSVYLGSASTYSIPQVLPSDTGWYVVHVTINNGCIRRMSMFNLNGSCSNILPVRLNGFSGQYIGDDIGLNWRLASVNDLAKVVIERKGANGVFAPIESVTQRFQEGEPYEFIDRHPSSPINNYRLKFVYNDQTFSYSNILQFSKKTQLSGLRVFPNPAKESCQVDWDGILNRQYIIQLTDVNGRTLRQYQLVYNPQNAFKISRNAGLARGVYFIKLLDTHTNEVDIQKIIFE